MDRAMGFEPTTSTLARLRSTSELRPLGERSAHYTQGVHAVKRSSGPSRWVVSFEAARLGRSAPDDDGGASVSASSPARAEPAERSGGAPASAGLPALPLDLHS